MTPRCPRDAVGSSWCRCTLSCRGGGGAWCGHGRSRNQGVARSAGVPCTGSHEHEPGWLRLVDECATVGATIQRTDARRYTPVDDPLPSRAPPYGGRCLSPVAPARLRWRRGRMSDWRSRDADGWNGHGRPRFGARRTAGCGGRGGQRDLRSAGVARSRRCALRHDVSGRRLHRSRSLLGDGGDRRSSGSQHACGSAAPRAGQRGRSAALGEYRTRAAATSSLGSPKRSCWYCRADHARVPRHAIAYHSRPRPCDDRGVRRRESLRSGRARCLHPDAEVHDADTQSVLSS